MDDKELRDMLKPKHIEIEDTDFVYEMDYEKEIKRLKIQVRGAWNILDQMMAQEKTSILNLFSICFKLDKQITLLYMLLTAMGILVGVLIWLIKI